MSNKGKYISKFCEYPKIILTLIILVFIYIFYSPILLHPNHFIFGDKGDAIKNYYCYDWHIHNDQSLINYTGTNYPFGELHTYTDGNPLLGNFIKIFSFLKPYSIAIYNISLLFSFIFCALLLFKIFKEFDLPKVNSIIASTGITILCPQAFRLAGHYALSYSFAIPLTFLLLILFENRGKQTLYSIWISFLIICLFFVHQYLGMISSSVVFLFWLFKISFNFSKNKSLLLHFLFQFAIPLLFYFTFLKIFDSHIDRPTNTYGFLYFTSNIETVFISILPPFRHFLSLIYKISIQNWEGIAYIGILTTITLFFMVAFLFRKRRSLPIYFGRNVNERTLLNISLGSILLLLFSMGYPFKWNMEGLLDKLPLIKQFRAPGRFAWAFYFASTISATIFLSRYFLRTRSHFIKTSSCVLLFTLYIIEGIPYHNSISKTSFTTNCFNEKCLEQELKEIAAKIKETNAQAILPLPAFHIGTDYYHLQSIDKLIRASFILSFYSGTPLLANLTPRTSLSEARQLIQVLGDDFLEKPIKNLLNNQPICLLYAKDGMREEERKIYDKSELVFETSGYVLKKIMPSELFMNSSQKQIDYFNFIKQKLIPCKGFLLNDTGYFETVAEMNIGTQPKEKYTLFKIPAGSLVENSDYEVRFWFKSDDLNNLLSVEEFDPSANKVKIISERNINSMPNIVQDKTLAILSFKNSKIENEYSVFLKKEKGSRFPFSITDLIIKSKNIDAFKLSFDPQTRDTVLLFNDFVLHRK